jgi:hypothetical protein
MVVERHEPWSMHALAPIERHTVYTSVSKIKAEHARGGDTTPARDDG